MPKLYGLLPPSMGLGELPKDIQGMDGTKRKTTSKAPPAKARTMPMGGGKPIVKVNPGKRKLGNKGY